MREHAAHAAGYRACSLSGSASASRRVRGAEVRLQRPVRGRKTTMRRQRGQLAVDAPTLRAAAVLPHRPLLRLDLGRCLERAAAAAVQHLRVHPALHAPLDMLRPSVSAGDALSVSSACCVVLREKARSRLLPQTRMKAALQNMPARRSRTACRVPRRAKTSRRRSASSLFDGPLFARHAGGHLPVETASACGSSAHPAACTAPVLERSIVGATTLV
jgi:hypothetical protein